MYTKYPFAAYTILCSCPLVKQNKNDIDRAGIQTVQERSRYQDILEKFESTIFDNHSEETTSQFLCEVLDLNRPYIAPDLVEIQEIDYADINQ